MVLRMNEPSPQIFILRRRQLEARVQLSRACIYDKLDPDSPRHDPTFPRPIKLGASAIGFIESEVNAWLTAQAEARMVSPTGKKS